MTPRDNDIDAETTTTMGNNVWVFWGDTQALLPLQFHFLPYTLSFVLAISGMGSGGSRFLLSGTSWINSSLLHECSVPMSLCQQSFFRSVNFSANTFFTRINHFLPVLPQLLRALCSKIFLHCNLEFKPLLFFSELFLDHESWEMKIVYCSLFCWASISI